MLLVVIGTGLMGGSFALAARRQGLFDCVLGIDPDARCRDRALRMGVVDEFVESVPAEADAVLLAGPSDSIAPWAMRLAEHPAVVFDTGSVKGAIVDAVRAAGPVSPRFIPCHPLVGSEQSGPEAADVALFTGARVIVTPTEEADDAVLERVRGWWRHLGAEVSTMSAQAHDRLLARTSHLPHLLAFAYLQLVTEEQLEHTAGGFRDFTRIGAADSRVWAPIFRLNTPAVVAALDEMRDELDRVRGWLEAGDEPALVNYLEAAARRRRSLGNG